jgi:DNA replication and repair protein RecF
MMPLLVMAPDDLKVVWEGAENRRRLLDWTMFHVEHRYLSTYQRYQRCLKQRNAALKAIRQSGSMGGNTLDQWDEQLAEAGEELDALRRIHLPAITAEMASLIASLLGEALECVYESGWSSTSSLGDALVERRGLDIARGYTSKGPHRSDLSAPRGGRAAKDTLSRGQGRLLVFAMHIAQVRAVVDVAHVRPVLLLDDVGSELDEENFARIFATLDDMDIQTFVTAVPNDAVARIADDQERVKVFHVEQGSVSEVL